MVSPDSEAAHSQTTDPFRPSWGRGLLTAGVAAAAFWIPQEIPLEYYPLNNPSSGLQYLELTYAANVRGETQIFLDTGRGFNELEKIQIPIGPSEMAFTYTFPLPDAPLFNLRLDPFAGGPGELRITNFRIINRREEEIRRFTPAHFHSANQIEGIVPTDDGWKIVTANGPDPSVHVRVDGPIVAEGMSERNLKRCLLSTGYLTLMLWIILLAVYFTFRWPRNIRDGAKSILFLAFMSACFSLVGNRGLIRNSARSAQVTPPWRMEVDVVTAQSDTAQLFWDAGNGFNETDSDRVAYVAAGGTQTLRFPLPDGRLHALRLDPFDATGRLVIRGVRVTDNEGRTRTTFPPSSFDPANEVAHINIASDDGSIEVTSNAVDPILLLAPAGVAEVNHARAQSEQR